MKWMFVIAILISQSLFAQKIAYNPDSVFKKELLLEDFNLFYHTLLEVHPSVHDFISEQDLSAVVTKIKESIVDSTDVYLFKKVSSILPFIGCGHTAVRAASQWISFASKTANIISIDVKLNNGDLIFWNQPFEDSISLRGCKIVSINGKTSQDIIQDIQLIISGDGISKALANYKIQKSFRYYYSISEGFSPEHHVKYLTIDNIVDSISLPCRRPLPSIKKKRADFEQFELIETGNQLNYYTLKTNKQIALLDIDAFSRSKFKPFYKTIFAQIEANKTNDLIIDLRNNGGGYFPHGNELLTYLIKENIYFNFNRPETNISKNKHLEMNFYSKLTKSLFNTMPDQVKNNERRDYQIKYKPQKKNAFSGNIYVLINNGSFSLSGYVAAYLKHHSNAFFIGQETAGGEYGSNAVLMYELTLPNTQHVIFLPYYFLDHQVDSITKGRGVIPNFKTSYTISDLINFKDLDIEYVLSKIQQS